MSVPYYLLYSMDKTVNFLEVILLFLYTESGGTGTQDNTRAPIEKTMIRSESFFTVIFYYSTLLVYFMNIKKIVQVMFFVTVCEESGCKSFKSYLLPRKTLLK